MLILEYIEQVEINNISKSELPTILHNMKENNTIKKKSTPYRYKITKNGPLRSCSCWYCIELDAFCQLFIMVTHLREKQKKKKEKETVFNICSHIKLAQEKILTYMQRISSQYQLETFVSLQNK